MTTVHVAMLRDAIQPFDTAERRQQYINGEFVRGEPVRDLDKRYRWDLLHDSMSPSSVCWFYDKGLNDTHIDTALRSIVPPLLPH